MNEEMKLQEIETILTNNQYNNTISIEDAAQAILAWHNANAQPQLSEAEIEQEAKRFAAHYDYTTSNCMGLSNFKYVYEGYKAALLARNTPVPEPSEETLDKIIRDLDKYLAEAGEGFSIPDADFMQKEMRQIIKNHLNPKP